MRTFGKTGEKLTIIGPAGGRFPMIAYEEAKAITWRAYELGINYFDTARLYWNGKSEEVYGEVLQPVRKKVFITSKCHRYSKAEAMQDLEVLAKGSSHRLHRSLADSPGRRDEGSRADLRPRRFHRSV